MTNGLSSLGSNACFYISSSFWYWSISLSTTGGIVGKRSCSLWIIMFVVVCSCLKISNNPECVISCWCTAPGVLYVSPPGSVIVQDGLNAPSPVPLIVTVSSVYV
jgi:hypothetical protein